MIHGPCGTINAQSPCMKEGQCTKRYPKSLTKETTINDDSYPNYRRLSPEDGGFQCEIRLRDEILIVDNRWVVPYSPVLLRAFCAHINVEMCSSVKSIKYRCKYVNKGYDWYTKFLR